MAIKDIQGFIENMETLGIELKDLKGKVEATIDVANGDYGTFSLEGTVIMQSYLLSTAVVLLCKKLEKELDMTFVEALEHFMDATYNLRNYDDANGVVINGGNMQ